MQTKTLRRYLKEYLFVCFGVCLWAGTVHAQNQNTVPSGKDIQGELDRETNLQLQLDTVLKPVADATKQLSTGARRIRAQYRPETPEYHQARDLYAQARKDLGRLQATLTDAVRTVKQDDSGERAASVNKQVIVDLNGALQAFGDLASRLGVVSAPVQPAPSPAAPPPSPSPGGSPAGSENSMALPTPTAPPGGQLTAAPGQPVQVSSDIVVQVCNLFVEHAAGLSNRSEDGIRERMIRQIQSRFSMPAFGA
ncbi:MAG: hypothetical protein JO069_09390 [Verrucomicrobia bacterium]|nr:hypothetical protein [Verrucomicrobiota bacterium]